MSLTVSPLPFTSERLKLLIDIERRHFWFIGRRMLVDGLLERYVGGAGATLADIGVGGGYYCEQLARRGYDVTAVDLLPDGLRRLAAEAPETKPVRCAAERLALADRSFDCVLSLDVLEHLDEHGEAAAEIARVLRPGGILIATVPALPWLWSYRDTAAGHRRRYTRASLRALLGQAGLSVERMGYYGSLLLPAAVASRLAGRVVPRTRDLEDMPPTAVNAVFREISRAEAFLTKLGVPWPWGSSLWAVARRAGT